MKSIVQDKKKCFLCGSIRETGWNALEEHHVFFGNPRRKLSEKHGLKVYLCGETCHRNGKKAAHRCRETDLNIKKAAQAAFERTHTRKEFVDIFGLNYLDEHEQLEMASREPETPEFPF